MGLVRKKAEITEPRVVTTKTITRRRIFRAGVALLFTTKALVSRSAIGALKIVIRIKIETTIAKDSNSGSPTSLQ